MDWTQEETRILINDYPQTPIPEIQKLLARHTKRAIYKRAWELGLKKKIRYIPNKRLSDEVIRKAWHDYMLGKKSIPEIAKEHQVGFSTIEERFISMFGKDTVRTIAKKHASKFSKRWRWTPTNKELREIFEQYKRSHLHLTDFVRKNLHGKISRKRLAKLFREKFPGEFEQHIEEKLHKAYKKGLNFEYLVRDYFTKKGYLVLRSPRSYGLADLVAIKKGDIKLIQCKVRGKMALDKQRSLVKLADSIGAEAILAIRKQGIKLKRLDVHV